MQGLPEVTLDTTLADLFARCNSDQSREQVALVLCAANSEIPLSSKVGRNAKYLYQDSTFSSTPKYLSPEQEKKIKCSTAIKYLSLVPQHDAFAAGNMLVILLNLDISEEDIGHCKEEAGKTIGTLAMHQKPEMLFVSSPKHICLEDYHIDRLVAKMELDELEGFPLAVDLDTHYFLNSKAALSTSGLPSPRSTLLELEGFSADPGSCCNRCRSNEISLTIPLDCTGSRGKWLKDQIQRTLIQVSSRRIPFVLKNQQTFGGGGTYMVSSPEELTELLSHLSSLILPKLFSQVNRSNAHLAPGTLILSEVIADPIGDWGLTFFVTKAGECIFLAVTQQVIDSTKAWIGSTISYTAQESLKQKFTPVMKEIGEWLHKYGYYGPCGADILETAPGQGNSNGSPNLNIVDLNVRTSGSLVLGLMRGHFSVRRGLHGASSFSVTIDMPRDEFVKMFENQFRDGKMVIVSWYQDIDSGVSYGNILIGAQDKSKLEETTAVVKKMASEIHF